MNYTYLPSINQINYEDNKFIFHYIFYLTIGIFINLYFKNSINKSDKITHFESNDDKLHKLRDNIEDLINSDISYHNDLSNIIYPCKDNLVRITGGKRWSNCIGKIRNYNNDKYNISIFKKYNKGNNNIPNKMLKNKSRDYFSVFTLNESEITS